MKFFKNGKRSRLTIGKIKHYFLESVSVERHENLEFKATFTAFDIIQ